MLNQKNPLLIILSILLNSLFMILPTSALAQSNFSNYPQTFPQYYNYARNNLFDNQEFFTKNGPQGTGGNITDCTPPPGVSAADVKTKYGLILGGDSLTQNKIAAMYQAMCTLFQSTTYQHNLNSVAQPVQVNFLNKNKCFAFTYANGGNPYVEMWEPCSDSVDRYVITHELVHVMQKSSPILGRNGFYNDFGTQVYQSEYNPPIIDHRIPTGPCMDPTERSTDNWQGECEADAVAEFVYYKDYRNGWGVAASGPPNFPTYPTDFPKWYHFAQKYFFGFNTSTDFYNLTNSTGTNPQPGTGLCSITNLTPYFGSAAAPTASCICQIESGGSTTAINKNCSDPNAPAHTDYSVGLFQINLLSHSPGSECFTQKGDNVICQFNQSCLNNAINYFENANNNIKYAANLYSAQHNWDAWTAEKGKCF